MRRTPMRHLKRAIKNKGFTQLELAEEVGLHFTKLNRYINGYTPMPEHICKFLADRLDITTKEVTQ